MSPTLTNLAHSSLSNAASQMPLVLLLNHRIVRGPLTTHENEAILSQYNLLTSANIPMHEFLRWIQSSPEGPAWHAILETDAGGIVGHQSLIPFRATYRGRKYVAAKSEYTFLREEFQAAKIRGLEQARGPKHFAAAHQLFERGKQQGWGPFIICNAAAARQGRGFYGFQSTDFRLSECLLTLRPWAAARDTPNLMKWQRVLIGLAGTVQTSILSTIRFCTRQESGIWPVPVSNTVLPEQRSALSFLEDQDSLRWRYLEGSYERIGLDSRGYEYMIVKKGSSHSYLRVCQWRLNAGQPSPSLLFSLVRMAERQRALGVRWAVYGDGEDALMLVQRLRSFGFLCAPRVRTLLIRTDDPNFLKAENWNLNDSTFSFHH